MTGTPTRRDDPPRLLGEFALLDDTGPPRVGRRPVRLAALPWLAPALVLLGVVVGWPIVRTVHASLFTADGRFAGMAHFRAAFDDPSATTAVANTIAWTLLVPVVVNAVGFVLAAATRRTRSGVLGTIVLVAPMALPLVVTGIAFRLLYDPSPRRGAATALAGAMAAVLGVDPATVWPWLGPELVTFSLMSAFVWAWVGIAVVVFRAAMDAIPHEIEDAARAEGATSWVVLRTVRLPMLRRTSALLLALIAVATSRAFDLLLVTAPGSTRDNATVLALHVWQTSGRGDTGSAAALAVVWLAIVALGMSFVVLGARQRWPLPVAPPGPRAAPRRWRWPYGRVEGPGDGVIKRPISRVVVALATLVWAFPLTLLAVTSLHSPTDAATEGWTALPSVESYRQLLTGTPMAGALVRTLALSLLVTVVVAVVSTLAAHALTWLRPTVGLGLLAAPLIAAAVVPVQVVAAPVDEALGLIGLSGTAMALVVVHIALGVPLSVLVLRQAFLTVPADAVRRARLHAGTEIEVLRGTVAPAARPALIAVLALQFVQVWNDLAVALLLGNPAVGPIGPVLLAEARQFTTSAGVLAAGAVVASVVPLLVVVLARRHIIDGLVSGVVRR